MERSRRQRAMEGLPLDGTVWFNVSFMYEKESSYTAKTWAEAFRATLGVVITCSRNLSRTCLQNAVSCQHSRSRLLAVLALITDQKPTHAILNTARNTPDSCPSLQ
jgi:hypothetical protein